MLDTSSGRWAVMERLVSEPSPLSRRMSGCGQWGQERGVPSTSPPVPGTLYDSVVRQMASRLLLDGGDGLRVAGDGLGVLHGLRGRHAQTLVFRWPTGRVSTAPDTASNRLYPFLRQRQLPDPGLHVQQRLPDGLPLGDAGAAVLLG